MSDRDRNPVEIGEDKWYDVFILFSSDETTEEVMENDDELSNEIGFFFLPFFSEASFFLIY